MEEDLTQRAQRLRHRGHGEFVLLLDGRIKLTLPPAACFNSDSGKLARSFCPLPLRPTHLRKSRNAMFAGGSEAAP